MLYSSRSLIPFARTLGEVPMPSTETSEENSILLTLNARVIKPTPTAATITNSTVAASEEEDEEEILFCWCC
jgi:hypothetical protein